MEEASSRPFGPRGVASVISVRKSLQHGRHGELNDLYVEGLCRRGR